MRGLLRNNVVLALGLFAALFLLGQGLCANELKIEIDDFRQVQHREDGSRQSVLAGERARIRGAQVEIQNVSLILYDASGDERLRVDTPRCLFDRERGVGRGKDWIRGRGPGLTLAGVGYVVNTEEQTLSVYSQVKMTIKRVVPRLDRKETEQ